MTKFLARTGTIELSSLFLFPLHLRLVTSNLSPPSALLSSSPHPTFATRPMTAPVGHDLATRPEGRTEMWADVASRTEGDEGWKCAGLLFPLNHHHTMQAYMHIYAIHGVSGMLNTQKVCFIEMDETALLEVLSALDWFHEVSRKEIFKIFKGHMPLTKRRKS